MKKISFTTVLLVILSFPFICHAKSNNKFFAGGSGTKDEPYQISTCRQLQNVEDDLNGNYVLNNDIDCSDTKNWNGGQGFMPISVFRGQIDGNDCVVSSLFISAVDQISVAPVAVNYGDIRNLRLADISISGVVKASTDYQSISFAGCVGVLASGGSVSNMSVSGSVTGYVAVEKDVVGSSVNVAGCVGVVASNSIVSDILALVLVTGEVQGEVYSRAGNSVGGIVGANAAGIVQNSFFVGAVSAVMQGQCDSCVNYAGGLTGDSTGQIKNSYSLGSAIKATSAFNNLAGGVSGRNGSAGTVSNSYSTNDILSEGSEFSYSGGVVAGNQGNIVNSYSNGSVVGESSGGLVGFNKELIKNCYSQASVIGEQYSGGLVGLNYGSISESFSTGYVSGGANFLGGLVGINQSGSISSSYYDANASGQNDTGKGMPKTTAQMMQESTFSGWDFANIWKITNAVDYPRLTWQQIPLKIVFIPIASPVKVNAPFSVTIKANDTKYNGRVSLRSTRGEVYPAYVTLTDGVWNGQVTVYSVGKNDQLILGWGDVATQGSGVNLSNLFDVTDKNGDIPKNGSLAGVVIDENNKPIVDAKLQLYSGDPKNGGVPIGEAVYTGAHGNYKFTNVMPGNFYIQCSASLDQDEFEEVRLAANIVVTRNFNLPQTCSLTTSKGASKVPILLIPGIMGSNKVSNGLPYPKLPADIPEWNSGRLKLFNPNILGFIDPVGWRTLRHILKGEFSYEDGCTLFEVPYDWSLPITEIRDRYLIPHLENIRKKTGCNEVDIVAHSMGGLVVRSYLQSPQYQSDLARGYKVRRFAMVGTPNEGSDNVYYLWEGGDLIKADKLGGTVSGPAKFFYTNTLSYLYDARGDTSDKKHVCEFRKAVQEWNRPRKRGCDTDKTYNFIHDKGISAGQLMSVYDSALQDGSGNNVKITKEENNFLLALDNLPCANPKGCVDKNDVSYFFSSYKDILTPDQTGVQTKLFIGGDHDTIQSIKVGKPGDFPYYQDGAPLPGDPLVIGNGDGTVLRTSVMFGNYLPTTFKSAEHSELIGKFSNRIVEFITGKEPKFDSMQAIDNSTSGLIINIDGRVQPVIESVAQLSFRGDSVTNSTNSRVLYDLDSSSIAVSQPIDGKYTVSLQSPYNEDYTISVLYGESEDEIYGVRTIGYYDETLSSFSFTIDSQKNGTNGTSPINFDRSFGSPDELEMKNIDNKIQLNWQDEDGDANKDVDHYEIYWLEDDQAYYQYLNRTKGKEKTYPTNHDWSEANVNTYIVEAILTGGSSNRTFFSQPTFYDGGGGN